MKSLLSTLCLNLGLSKLATRIDSAVNRSVEQKSVNAAMPTCLPTVEGVSV
ncbi:hypothetical protein QEH59_17365 [Coraliomargarita sp. SDUM461004]|uniref:Uncharacterized protein n=1 Tax=Thalassobacterium sedimentorum TaxID=3041258 RepID=A0ABU1ANC1_9BACT|nr:hypothetical protein [Coraliomargarita sp. SDUM461004]